MSFDHVTDGVARREFLFRTAAAAGSFAVAGTFQAFGANACATTRRWILQVAVRGMVSVM